MEIQSNNTLFKFHSTAIPRMKLLPCFDISEFNVGMMIDSSNSDSTISPELMQYAFTLKIEHLS